MFRYMVLALVMSSVVLPDIPDRTVSWDVFETYDFDGTAKIEDISVSRRGTDFRVLLSTVSDGAAGIHLLELDSDGAMMNSTGLSPSAMDDADWTAAAFLSGDLIAIAYGSSSVAARLVFLDPGNPENSTDIAISDLYPGAASIKVTSVEPSGPGILMAGKAYMLDERDFLFAACLDSMGDVRWKTDMGMYECDLIRTCLVPLRDGGCVLSDVPDAFPSSSIPVYRLGPEGDRVWMVNVPLDCDLHASINDFIETEEGNIILAGSYDPIVPDAFRGLTVCLDPTGRELWRRTDWYLDHTSFTLIFDSNEQRLALAGWTGLAGEYMMDVHDSDVLIALLQPEEDRIRGYRVEADGDQRPFAVYPLGEGEFIVLGEHVPEGSSETRVFFGRFASIP